MQQSKILITGGSGLVGQNLTNHLIKNGYTNLRVHLHKRNARIKHESVEYVIGSLMSHEKCLEVTKDVDIVIHAAASTSNAVDTVNDPLAHVTPNVAMNNFLIDASYRNKVKKYIFLSSNTVYPPKGDDPVEETDFLFDAPYPVYFPVGWMKRYAEVQCELYAKYLPNPMTTIVVRPANLYGPHDKYDFAKCHVTPATIRKVADNVNPIPIWGDGTELRDLLYIDDFVDAIQILIEKQHDYDVFNVGSNTVYSVNEVLERMKILAQNNNEVTYVKGKPSMIPVRKISSEKFMNKFNWQPEVDLDQGLKTAFDWYLANKQEFN